MLQQPTFPVMIGFCQYEPNVLKITPPLNSTEDELRRMCATIGERGKHGAGGEIDTDTGQHRLAVGVGVRDVSHLNGN